MTSPQNQKLSRLLNRRAILRTRDLREVGSRRTALAAPLAAGMISRLSRGVYAVAGHDVSEHHSFDQAAARVPRGVVCLRRTVQERRNSQSLKVRAVGGVPLRQ